MTDFGDSEPEDAWEADDPVPEQVINLRHRLAALVDETDLGDLRHELQLIRIGVAISRLHRLSERAQLRADDLDADIDLVLSRLP